MQLTDIPSKLVLPWADSGGKSTIPVASQIGITPGAASLTDGFPPLTRTPESAGGIGPDGLEMNGILYDLSDVVRWANAGGGYPYDGTFATDANVGGYPKGARVMRSDGLGYWFNTTDDNVTDPEGAGAVAAGWVPDFTTGATAVTMTSANVTLTALQYGKPIIVISGLLTANLNLIFPNIAGKWTVINGTTGAYTITCKTAAGTGADVSSAQTIVGDATNIYLVNSSIGYGQTWQTVTGSRVIGTTYYNTTGRPIAGHVRATITSAGESVIASVGGSSLVGPGAPATYGSTVFFIVPPGAAYVVQISSGGGAVNEWLELR